MAIELTKEERALLRIAMAEKVATLISTGSVIGRITDFIIPIVLGEVDGASVVKEVIGASLADLQADRADFDTQKATQEAALDTNLATATSAFDKVKDAAIVVDPAAEASPPVLDVIP